MSVLFVPPLGRDFCCPHCGCAHRFTPCDTHPECLPHPLDDDIEP